MIIVDTSVWIDYFNGKPYASGLSHRLLEGDIVVHRWVEAELRMGSLPGKRDVFLSDLSRLPAIESIPMDELFLFIEKKKLFGKGLSIVDAAILASAKAYEMLVWTAEKRLREMCAAERLSYS